MATRCKVLGAGLSGCALTAAARALGWDVVMADASEEALKRAQKEIFPNRHGRWDTAVQTEVSAAGPRGGFDVILVAVEPALAVAAGIEALGEKPKALVLGSPPCPPSLERADELAKAAAAAGIPGYCMFEHPVSRGVELLQEMVSARQIGEVQSIEVEWRDHWDGILKGMPWHSRVSDAVLGNWERGGGAAGEHAQAVHLWTVLAAALGKGRVAEVGAMVSYAQDGEAMYDERFDALLRTDSGFSGRVVCDLLTKPARKRARVHGADGMIELSFLHTGESDAIFLQRSGAAEKITPVHKKRAEDYQGLLRHVYFSYKDGKPSPVSLERGLDTAVMIAAGHMSEGIRGRVRIDWEQGWAAEAIAPAM
ncbi:MAG: hypothetical protein HUU15_02965 [Candidatus Brocadiae bacterium]|nr:hypothetical protein [Candidatus Brocadiia bacterium]